MTAPISVAVIGAGMASRSHMQAYRSAQTVPGSDTPPVRLTAVADVNEDYAGSQASRYGFERYETSWEAIAEADDIDAVSIVVANHLHRPIAGAQLASGKHVLCEKSLSGSVEDAEAMVAAATIAGKFNSAGSTYRRSPAVSAIREQIRSGRLGEVLHFNGQYWCDYAADPKGPMSWRYAGELGSGALADIGSHVLDLGESLCGPIIAVHGAQLPILIKDRPVPLGVALGHAGGVETSDVRQPVTNEDIATFTVEFANGAVGTFSVSRVAIGFPNGLRFQVFGDRAGANFDWHRPDEFGYVDHQPDSTTNGWRQVLVGPQHPYLADTLAMPFAGVGYGGQENFTLQARAFLEEIAGVDRLPRCPTFADGLPNMRLEQVIVTAAQTGASVTLADR